MKIISENIFHDPRLPDVQEFFEVIAEMDNVRIERIITQHPFTSPGKWYDQAQDEWVMLLKGEAEIEILEQGVIKLVSGDHIFIPAHCKHRLIKTSSDPSCTWLAVHGQIRDFKGNK